MRRRTVRTYVLTLIVAIFVLLPAIGVSAQSQFKFSDVEGHWAESSIKFMAEAGLMAGYPDGSFGVDEPVTRAETAAVLARDLRLNGGNETFPDVEADHWAEAVITAVAEAGIMNGYPDGTFRPNQPLSREEMAATLVTAYDLSGTSEIPFSDVNAGDWSYHSIQVLLANNITGGYPDGTFRPDRQITRAEFAVFLTRITKIGNADDHGDQEEEVPPVMELETKFENRILVETNDEGVVQTYDSKEDAIDSLSEIMLRSMAEEYADRFFHEKDGEVYIYGTEAPLWIDFDKAYELEQIREQQYRLSQEHSSILRGHVRLIITYEIKDGQWIMTDRTSERINEDTDNLENIQNQVYHLDELYERFSVKIISAGTSEGTFNLHIRKLNQHREPMSEEELKNLKEAIYEAVGSEFPLVIHSFTIQGEADISGEITSIDQKHQRVLIVNTNDTFGKDNENPEANWIHFASDSNILQEDSNLSFEDLKVGQTVEAWNTGMVMLSYPAQSTVLELRILQSEEGTEDLQGEVTDISESEKDSYEKKLVVDGEEVWLTENILVWIGEEEGNVEDIQAGDTVKIWYLGYTLLEERKVAGQVVIEDSFQD